MEKNSSDYNSLLTLENISFTWVDYAFFSVMLMISLMTGIYFGCFGKKVSTANDYLMGGKKMKTLPIAISLVASHVSGIVLLAVPADVYHYGITYWLSIFAVIVGCLSNAYVFMPVFFKLQITSTYEYLQMRFDKRVQKFTSFIFATSFLHFLPIIIYIPSLAFAQVSGIHSHIITPIVCAICIFYTTVGGIKAVVWTDAIQFGAIILGVFSVMIIGVLSIGGFGEAFELATKGERLQFDFDPSPLKHNTFWSAFIGLMPAWVLYVGLHQNAVQKCLSLDSMKQIKKALSLFAIGMIIMNTCCTFIGILIYAKYHDCDPLSSKMTTAHDQLLPLFTMTVAGKIPGLPGLFISAIVCTALSTLSAYMNCLAGTIYKDFIFPFVKKDISQKTVSNILKLIVILTGVTSTAIVFVVEKLGGLFPLAMSFGGIANGPLLGIFSMGMLVPWANTNGALSGGISSLLIMTWIVIGSQWYKAHGLIKMPIKPISVDGCEHYFNQTISTLQNSTMYGQSSEAADLEPFFLYKINFYYYILMGALIVWLIGLPVSLATRAKNSYPDSSLISPVSHWMLPKDEERYHDIEKSKNILVMQNKVTEEY